MAGDRREALVTSSRIKKPSRSLWGEVSNHTVENATQNSQAFGLTLYQSNWVYSTAGAKRIDMHNLFVRKAMYMHCGMKI